MATTHGCVTRRSTEIAKNSSTISPVRPSVFTPYRVSISASSTVGPMNTPAPHCPNAFISALSSNSPATRGRRLFASHHRSRRDLTASVSSRLRPRLANSGVSRSSSSSPICPLMVWGVRCNCSRARDAACLGDLPEVVQVLEVHRRDPSVYSINRSIQIDFTPSDGASILAALLHRPTRRDRTCASTSAAGSFGSPLRCWNTSLGVAPYAYPDTGKARRHCRTLPSLSRPATGGVRLGRARSGFRSG